MNDVLALVADNLDLIFPNDKAKATATFPELDARCNASFAIGCGLVVLAGAFAFLVLLVR